MPFGQINKLNLEILNLEKAKQGPALILSLEGKAQEVTLQLGANEISAENGAQNVIAKIELLIQKGCADREV